MIQNCIKKIFIFGLGYSGRSVVKYYISKNNKIFAWDDNDLVREEVKNEFPEINICNPKEVSWKNIFFIIISPGISQNHKLLDYPRRLNIPFYRDLEIFSQNVDNKKVIAVTGTNGKSTTVSFIGNMLSLNEKNVFIGGNLKPPLIEALKIGSYNKYVIELSSYQLELAPSFNSYISILLNIHEDHIERYGNIHNYSLVKKKIFQNFNNEKYAIISLDDPISLSVFQELNNTIKKAIPISVEKKLKQGVFFANNCIIDNYFEKNIINLSNQKNTIFINNNKQNILASYVVSKILRYNNDLFLNALKCFKSLKHRSEIIYQNNKLLVVNDSKATNLSSTMHSIKSNNEVHLIMGGTLKNKNFDVLKNLKNKIRKIYLIGEASDYIFEQLKDDISCEKCNLMDVAVKKCFNDIKKINQFSTILLSPACSSFDQYKDFESRG